jgi:hypothetical protein
MHITTDRAAMRHTHLPRNSMTNSKRVTRKMPAPALLSPLELRRLVAAMVD